MAKKPASRVLRILWWLVLLTSGAHALAVAGLLNAMNRCGEGDSLVSPLLYLPPQGWLLPLGVLFPLALFVCRWAVALHALAAGLVLMGFMNFHSLPRNYQQPAFATNELLTVITANFGQRTVKSLQPFIEEMAPDVIAFQEKTYRKKAFDRDYTGYTVKVIGEFTLASKLPIQAAALVPDLAFENRPVAARFELEYLGRRIALYSVHMPTPRAFLNVWRWRRIIAETLAGGGYFDPENRRDFKYYWDERFWLARGLLAVLEKEKLPTLVVGDFNTPDHGELYRLFAGRYTDSFALVGEGYGFTFPANAHVPVAGFRPWLRLDYQFADANWEILDCEVEPLIRAQHLAVAAAYRLKK